MKLRIKGNTLRLRLTISEVEKICDSGYIEERTLIGNDELVYALKRKDDIESISAGMSGNKITVYIPSSFTNGWYKNDVTGFDNEKFVDGNNSLFILIEKDFQCIENTEEDQSDNYINPNKSCLG